jgi:hypothetical protein
MKRTITLAIAAIFSFLILFLIAAEYYSNHLKPQTAPSPTPYVYPYIKQLPSYVIEPSSWQANVTQGESLQINLTLISFLNETATFAPKIQLAGYGNAEWDPSKDSTKVYNATFTQERLVLKPFGNATITLAMNFSQDAQLGRYLFDVSFSSNLDSSSVVGASDGLTVMVVPKTI